MPAPRLVRFLLLALVLGSVAVFASRQLQREAAARNPGTPSIPTSAVLPLRVVVTYFTMGTRCDSCRKIEALASRAVNEGFASDLAAGTVVFRVVDTDLPENASYLDHYDLANKTVIVSREESGVEKEWVDRQDVWVLLDEPERFLAYVQEPVRRFLGRS